MLKTSLQDMLSNIHLKTELLKVHPFSKKLGKSNSLCFPAYQELHPLLLKQESACGRLREDSRVASVTVLSFTE